MIAAADDVDFEDRLEHRRMVAAARRLLSDCRAHGAPLASIQLRENVPRRFYATRGSGLRSPALICAELGARFATEV